MIKHLVLLLVATLAFAAASLAADVEYSTTGAMDTPATMGGDRDGWGTEFITRWDNTTGADVIIEEFGWPCGGWWSQFWYVWIAWADRSPSTASRLTPGSTMPGTWTATSAGRP